MIEVGFILIGVAAMIGVAYRLGVVEERYRALSILDDMQDLAEEHFDGMFRDAMDFILQEAQKKIVRDDRQVPDQGSDSWR